MLLGLIETGVRADLYQEIESLQIEYPPVSITVLDRYYADFEYTSLISASDVVCIPYTNFIGSSNVMMHAAAQGRLVLAPEFGVLGELTRRYKLGVTCDTSDPKLVTEAIFKSVDAARRICDKERQSIISFATRYAVSLEQFGVRVCDVLLEMAAR